MAFTDINRGNGVMRYRSRLPFNRICRHCGKKFLRKGKFQRLCDNCIALNHLKTLQKIKERNRLKLPLRPTRKELKRIKVYLIDNGIGK